MKGCDHSSTRFVLTPDTQHYGKNLCVACGTFLRWVKKPENIERDAETGRRIVDLRGRAFLSEWEGAFISSLDGNGAKLSPKQRDVLNRIWEKYNNA